ncbi:MAG: flagellar basal body L-ring protein FlgH [Rhizobiaceae bacterium]
MLEIITSLSGRVSAWIVVGCLLVMVSGCSPSFHDLGIPPTLTAPGNSIRPNRLQPTMAPKPIKVSQRYTMANNSFWDEKDGIYFRDSRAYEVGDILTVRIVMNESAKFKNKSDRESSASGGISAASDFSYGKKVSPTLALDTSGNLTTKLERGGNINRSEALKLSVAAVVIEAASNGNLYIHGTQEVRVNHEIRVLTVQGFVRSRDILPDNTIAYDKIAEARISYGGDNTRKREKLFFNPHHNSSRRSATRWMRN